MKINYSFYLFFNFFRRIFVKEIITMKRYLVTTELKTPWWFKVLRFFRLKSKRNEFHLTLKNNHYKENDVLSVGVFNIKIIK